MDWTGLEQRVTDFLWAQRGTVGVPQQYRLHSYRRGVDSFTFRWLEIEARRVAPRPTPIPEDQVSVFISPRGRVDTHFSRLLRHAWVTVGLFLFPGHHTGYKSCSIHFITQLHVLFLHNSLHTQLEKHKMRHRWLSFPLRNFNHWPVTLFPYRSKHMEENKGPTVLAKFR
jgi:hypothetical protein